MIIRYVCWVQERWAITNSSIVVLDLASRSLWRNRHVVQDYGSLAASDVDHSNSPGTLEHHSEPTTLNFGFLVALSSKHRSAVLQIADHDLADR